MSGHRRAAHREVEIVPLLREIPTSAVMWPAFVPQAGVSLNSQLWRWANRGVTAEP